MSLGIAISPLAITTGFTAWVCLALSGRLQVSLWIRLTCGSVYVSLLSVLVLVTWSTVRMSTQELRIYGGQADIIRRGYEDLYGEPDPKMAKSDFRA